MVGGGVVIRRIFGRNWEWKVPRLQVELVPRIQKNVPETRLAWPRRPTIKFINNFYK